MALSKRVRSMFSSQSSLNLDSTELKYSTSIINLTNKDNHSFIVYIELTGSPKRTKEL